MFRRKVRLRITTTSHRSIAFHHGLQARCPACEREVPLVTQADAAGILRVDAVTVNRFVAEGQVHAVQTISGSVWVCKDSLFLK